MDLGLIMCVSIMIIVCKNSGNLRWVDSAKSTRSHQQMLDHLISSTVLSSRDKHMSVGDYEHPLLRCLPFAIHLFVLIALGMGFSVMPLGLPMIWSYGCRL